MAEVFGCLRPRLLGLEKWLPHVFVLRAEEPLQGPGTGWVELPHILLTRLTGENPVKEHHLDHIDKLDVLVHHAPMRVCSTDTSSDDTQFRPFSS